MNETELTVTIVTVGKLSESQRDELVHSIAEAISQYSTQHTLVESVEGIDVLVRNEDDVVAIMELSNI